MAAENLVEPLKVGTLVRIRESGYFRAKIAEDRGLLGPKGTRIYRVVVQSKPHLWLEVREDQLEVLLEE